VPKADIRKRPVSTAGVQSSITATGFRLSGGPYSSCSTGQRDARRKFLVSITRHGIIERRSIEAGQPAVSLEEFEEAERTWRADERYRAALAKRGITDLDSVIIDLYGADANGDDGTSNDD
jgi:Cu2+-containing amine oxidase